MAKGFDISVLGVKALEKQFKTLTQQSQGKVLRPAIRSSAKRAKDRVVANLSGNPVAVRTGRTLRAFMVSPVRSAARSRDTIKIGQLLPEREALGIPKDAKHYYPLAIEYGHKRAAARPFMRPAIDDHADSEFATIARDVGEGIVRLATKLRRR